MGRCSTASALRSSLMRSRIGKPEAAELSGSPEPMMQTVILRRLCSRPGATEELIPTGYRDEQENTTEAGRDELPPRDGHASYESRSRKRPDWRSKKAGTAE